MLEKQETLLEKAKKVPFRQKTRYTVTLDEVELAYAWADGTVSLKQISVATGRNPNTGNTLYFLESAFRYGIEKGLLIKSEKMEEELDKRKE